MAVAGDLVDEKEHTLGPALSLIEGVRPLKTYHVTGNHETAAGNMDFLQREMQDKGVCVLRNEKTEIHLAGKK